MITPAQETITLATISSVLVCGIITYTIIKIFALADDYSVVIALVAGSLLVSSYVASRVTVHWLGRPLNDILQ